MKKNPTIRLKQLFDDGMSRTVLDAEGVVVLAGG
jgi:hypothetical protein